MSIYEEQLPKEPLVKEPESSLYEALNNQLGTLLDYEELLYWYEQACDANDKAEMHSLNKQIIAYQKRWSLECYST